MHRSRLAGFIVDCQTKDIEGAATFWSAALGLETAGRTPGYVELAAKEPLGLAIEVQAVDHPSRVHLDIESDDIEAEVTRLVRAGAKRVDAVHTWVVLEAPTGQRFCVIRAKRSLEGVPGATAWNDDGTKAG